MICTPAIDLGTLRLFVGADDELAVLDFLRRFFIRLDADMGSMRDAITRQGWPEAVYLAHHMRSSALAIGAAGFVLLCASLERAARVPQRRQAELRFGALECSFNEMRSAVTVALAGN